MPNAVYPFGMRPTSACGGTKVATVNRVGCGFLDYFKKANNPSATVGWKIAVTHEEVARDLGSLHSPRLTPRERAILIQVVDGRLNKQIAGEMGITETTVKVHRSNMMRKIKAASVAELCRIADKLKLLPNSKPS